LKRRHFAEKLTVEALASVLVAEQSHEKADPASRRRQHFENSPVRLEQDQCGTHLIDQRFASARWNVD
jgi:hypothetical protein